MYCIEVISMFLDICVVGVKDQQYVVNVADVVDNLVFV